MKVNKKRSLENEKEFVIMVVFVPMIFALHYTETHNGPIHLA